MNGEGKGQTRPTGDVGASVHAVRRVGETPAIAVFVESAVSAANYLATLEKSSGLRWALTSDIVVFRTMLSEMGDCLQLVVLDFQSGLTEKLQFYMEVVRRDRKGDIPVLFLPSEDMVSRAERIKEREVDRILVRPFTPEELESAMGHILGRSERREIQTKFWIILESRMVEGRTTNLSSTGMGGVIPDPILFSEIKIRLFSPDDRAMVDLLGKVRRKVRLAEGGYQLGIEFLRIIGGDPHVLRPSLGIDLTHLKRLGEETLAALEQQNKK